MNPLLLALLLVRPAAADVGQTALSHLRQSSGQEVPGAPEVKAAPVAEKPAARAPQFDEELAGRLADKAAGVAESGKIPKGHCYEGVAKALELVGIIEEDDAKGAIKSWHQLGFYPDYNDHAFQFTLWARAFPDRLIKTSLREIPLPRQKAGLKPGTILVYQPRACGFNEKSGHIEVVSKSGRGCSFVCLDIDEDCLRLGPERIAAFVPVR